MPILTGVSVSGVLTGVTTERTDNKTNRESEREHNNRFYISRSPPSAFYFLYWWELAILQRLESSWSVLAREETGARMESCHCLAGMTVLCSPDRPQLDRVCVSRSFSRSARTVYNNRPRGVV